MLLYLFQNYCSGEKRFFYNHDHVGNYYFKHYRDSSEADTVTQGYKTFFFGKIPGVECKCTKD